MDIETLAKIIEAILLTAGEPVTYTRLQQCFEEDAAPSKAELDSTIQWLQESYAKDARSFIIKELAGGYVIQAKQEYAPYIVKLWEEKPAKYSRAYLETLVIIAYRQPITRAEIEDIRGVAVSSSIMKTLQERDWIKLIGHRDIPGKPGLYGTTKTFLDYFNLKSLDELPTLKEIQDLDQMASRLQEQLNFEEETEETFAEVAENNLTEELQETAEMTEEISEDLDFSAQLEAALSEVTEQAAEPVEVEEEAIDQHFIDEIEAALHELADAEEEIDEFEKEVI